MSRSKRREAGSRLPYRVQLAVSSKLRRSLRVARAGLGIGRREHGVGGGAELVLAQRRRMGDPVLEELDVGVVLVREHLASAVEDALHERLDDEPALRRVADDDHALGRVEVLVDVGGADDVRRVRRIAHVERRRGTHQTESAAGACHRVVTATAGAGVGGRATLALQLSQEDRVDAPLEVREGEVLVALGALRIAHHGWIPEGIR